MKVDFNFKLVDRKGNPIKDGDSELFANELLATILDNPTEETKDPFKLLKVNKLINELYKSGKVDIDSEDAIMIKKAVSSFPVKIVISAQIIEAIEDLKKNK